MGYKHKAILGFSAQTSFKFISYLIKIIKTLILARLLSPNDFGLFTLVAITLGISESLTETGINITFLQTKKRVEDLINTAWVISIIRGIFIAIIMIIFGIILNKLFFHKIQLPTLVGFASLVAIIRGFINPSVIIYQKNLSFIKDSIYKTFLIIVDAISTVGASMILPSVLGLIIGLIVAAIVEVIASFIIFKYHPKFYLIKSQAKYIFNNTKWLSYTTFINYLNEHLDDLIIGQISGIYLLGLYNRAYTITHKLTYDISKSISYSNLPIFTKLKKNNKRLVSAFHKSLFAAILLMILIPLPLLIFPKQIILLVLGEKWLEIVPLIRTLAIAGIIQGIAYNFYTFFLSIKKYKPINTHLTINVVLMVIFTIWFGKLFSLQGAIIGLTIARLISLPLIIATKKRKN